MMAINRSLISSKAANKIADTPDTTPVMFGRTVARSQSSVEDTDSKLGRISEESHCSREVAAEL